MTFLREYEENRAGSPSGEPLGTPEDEPGILEAPGAQKSIPEVSKSMILVPGVERGGALAPPRVQPKTLGSGYRKLVDKSQDAEYRARGGFSPPLRLVYIYIRLKCRLDTLVAHHPGDPEKHDFPSEISRKSSWGPYWGAPRDP